jgi:hypothetical protein
LLAVSALDVDPALDAPHSSAALGAMPVRPERQIACPASQDGKQPRTGGQTLSVAVAKLGILSLGFEALAERWDVVEWAGARSATGSAAVQALGGLGRLQQGKEGACRLGQRRSLELLPRQRTHLRRQVGRYLVPDQTSIVAQTVPGLGG